MATRMSYTMELSTELSPNHHHNARGIQNRQPSRAISRQGLTQASLLLLAILVTFKLADGLGLCTESTLIGTKETGHYVFYNISDPQDFVVTQEQSRHSFLRNRNGPDTIGFPPKPLPPNATLSLRIASYNIRAAYPSDRGKDCLHPFGWEARVDQVAEQINMYHPDVIGLQEDTYYQINQLNPFLINYEYVGVNRDDCEDSPDEAKSLLNPFGVTRYDGDCEASKKADALVHGGEFNSIWFRPDTVDLQSWGVFWLGSSTAQAGSHFYNSTCAFQGFGPSCDVGRIVTWAQFRPKGRPYDFFVFNTHVTSQSEGNARTPETLIRKIKDIAGHKLSYTLGDFAMPQFSSRYQQYYSYLNDPDNPHGDEPLALRQWPSEANTDYRRGGRDDPPHGTFGPFVDSEGAVYDFIWGHHISVLSMLNDRLRNTTKEERRRLRSDHRMLLATVEFKDAYFFHDNGLEVQYPPHLMDATSSAGTAWKNGYVLLVLTIACCFLQ